MFTGIFVELLYDLIGRLAYMTLAEMSKFQRNVISRPSGENWKYK